MMENYPVNEALDNMEGDFEIDLVNGLSGVTYVNAPVWLTSTMNEIVQEYHTDLGINPKAKVHFVNKRTGKEETDGACSVEQMGLKAGDVLCIIDDGCVA